MKGNAYTLETVLDNNQRLDPDRVEEILILFEDRLFFIGDSLIRVDRLKFFKLFFKKARISVNFGKRCNRKIFEVLLKNNPNIDAISVSEWFEIDMTRYDTIFCIMHEEDRYLEFLHEQYGDFFCKGLLRLAVFSVSGIVLGELDHSRFVFPVNKQFGEFVAINETGRPRELYITREEKEWGNHWLEANGVKKNENVFILIDSSASRAKLLKMDVYLEFLENILNREQVKVLIFDENNIGKAEFYRELLSDEGFGKMVFSKGLTLREDLCIIGSGYTRVIFGPCTGLMHCASGIYNHYLKSEICGIGDIPLIITYTGEYPPADENAAFWWKNSPLVNCLLLQKQEDGAEIVLLNDLTEKEKRSYSQIPCSEYTVQMLEEFLNRKLILHPDQGTLEYDL
jgi:hypothetical protein